MSTLGIIRSMSEEQARRISPVIRAMRAGNIAGAKGIMEDLTVEELDTLVDFLKAAQAEKREGKSKQ